jgi:hypothetical protein
MTTETTEQGAPEGEAVTAPGNELVAPDTGKEQPAEEANQHEVDMDDDNVPVGIKRKFAKLTAQKYEARRQAEERAAEAERHRAEAEALKATIAALKEQSNEPVTVAGQPVIPSTEADIEKKAKEIVEARQFNAKADEVYEAGKKKFPDFDDSVSVLRNVGVMNKPFLDAVFEVGPAPEILHYLGTHPDEADRLRGLNPVKLGVEMAKLASNVTKPKPVSAAPAPIVTVDGTAKAEVDPEKMTTEERIAWRRSERAKRRA